jgi:acetylornithine deacetylase/succinyl-diaminopimelate desuccinylase-like protein
MNDTAHSDNEWVSVSSIAACARVYLGTAIRYCGLA